MNELVGFLNSYFVAERYPDDANGVYRPTEREIEQLGLALEPTPAVLSRAEAETFDALFLHRPWKLDDSSLEETGVLAYHLAFDEALTLGYNPRLADALLLQNIKELGYKEERVVGMIGGVAEMSFEGARALLEEVFGGLETTHATASSITRIAVVGAMSRKLVREAAERGAALYVTGQWRDHAAEAVEKTGIGVLAIGHERCEVWGLHALAHLLEERFRGLKARVLEP